MILRIPASGTISAPPKIWAKASNTTRVAKYRPTSVRMPIIAVRAQFLRVCKPQPISNPRPATTPVASTVVTTADSARSQSRETTAKLPRVHVTAIKVTTRGRRTASSITWGVGSWCSFIHNCPLIGKRGGTPPGRPVIATRVCHLRNRTG